jgi:hypothetical protein
MLLASHFVQGFRVFACPAVLSTLLPYIVFLGVIETHTHTNRAGKKNIGKHSHHIQYLTIVH